MNSIKKQPLNEETSLRNFNNVASVASILLTYSTFVVSLCANNSVADE